MRGEEGKAEGDIVVVFKDEKRTMTTVSSGSAFVELLDIS